MKKLLPLLLIIFALYGCTDCGPQQELSVRISINTGKDSIHLNQLYALGAVDQQVFQKQVAYFNKDQYFSKQFELPISLLADSTTYVFGFNNRTDTLTLFYQRDFYYKDKCGFVIDTKQPARLENSISTFSQVHVNYESYLKEKFTFPSGIGGNGIYLDITL